MWTLWLFPLVALSFCVGVAVAVLWYLLRGKRRKTADAAAVAVAVPFGCAALPVIALALLAAVGSLFEKSDTQLYVELFGHQPALGENRMLFNHFGKGANRQIFMRAEASSAEREKMLAAAPLRPSELTLKDFAELGTRHSFSWWISTAPHRGDLCKSARVREADGFHGWRQFRVAECLDGGTDFPDSLNTRYVYVTAWGRP